MKQPDGTIVQNPPSNAELEVRIVDLEKTNKNKQDQINLLTELVNTFGKKVDELLQKGN